MSAPHLAIGALSRRVGCPIETVRYYERIRLLPRPARTAGGYRMYDEAAVRRLAFVLRSRSLGFSLPEVRALLGLAEGRKPSCAAARDLAAAHLAEIREKIDDLRQMGRILAGMVEACAEGQRPACPLIEALYRAPEASIERRCGKIGAEKQLAAHAGRRKRTAEVKENRD
jgi:MerR family mercuric resistance operon transcriptional regulator